MSKETALVTGASSGIGLELSREFARNGHPLIITATSEVELRKIAGELSSAHNVRVEVIAQDLKTPAATEEIFNRAMQLGGIDILVNNAGFGQKGHFWEIPLERDLAMLRVNVEAVLRLTKLFLPGMLERRRGRILNTASIAGFEPGPSLAVYHATKAFVLSLSESLATELKDTGITLTALCPGATDTDFFEKADMVQTRIFQKGNVMAPQDVAKAAYKALMHGDRVVITGGVNKAIIYSRHLMPESAQAKFNEKLYKDVAPKKLKRAPGGVASKKARGRAQPVTTASRTARSKRQVNS
jgi:short-subunit dehydrogenase